MLTFFSSGGPSKCCHCLPTLSTSDFLSGNCSSGHSPGHFVYINPSNHLFSHLQHLLLLLLTPSFQHYSILKYLLLLPFPLCVVLKLPTVLPVLLQRLLPILFSIFIKALHSFFSTRNRQPTDNHVCPRIATDIQGAQGRKQTPSYPLSSPSVLLNLSLSLSTWTHARCQEGGWEQTTPEMMTR